MFSDLPHRECNHVITSHAHFFILISPLHTQIHESSTCDTAFVSHTCVCMFRNTCGASNWQVEREVFFSFSIILKSRHTRVNMRKRYESSINVAIGTSVSHSLFLTCIFTS